MAKLINASDNSVLRDINELKNAIFFKDMLAFYDAYKGLMESDTELLPSFCYHGKQFSLEGICLFMKDYSAELGFETLNLDLNYLRIIYYSIASFSSNGVLCERKVIEDEFEQYKAIVSKKEKELSQKKYELEKSYNYLLEDYNKKLGKNIKNKTLQHTFNFLSIFFLVTGIFCVIAPFTFYFLNSLQLIFAFIASLGCVGIGLTLFFVFKKLSKVYNATENGSVYEVNSSKKAKKDQDEMLKKLLYDYSYLSVEKYECFNSLNQELFGFGRLSFSEILKRAKEYKILSYNIKRDAIILFQNQQKDIDEILKELSLIDKSSDSSKSLGRLYKEICKKDWLQYNSQVRCYYIAKFIEMAGQSYNYELYGAKSGTLPFKVNVKAIAKETIAYLKSRDSLFVSSSADKFITSNYLKKQNIFKLKNDMCEEDYLNLKMAYITRFYDYSKVSAYNNLFYDKKIGKGARVPDNIIESHAKLPNLIFLKLRIKEDQLNFENTNSQKLKQIAEILFKSDEEFKFEEEITKQIDVLIIEENIGAKTIYECDEVIDDGNIVKYRFGNQIVKGYKI